jgi:dimethylhistidine N-methyltransferase
VLERYAAEIIQFAGNQPLNLVELGAGDGRKTKILIRQLQAEKLPFQYVPIDISESTVVGLIDNMIGDFPSMQIQGIVSEYFKGIHWLSKLAPKLNMVLFLGSNIGNFHRSEARTFLRTLWNTLFDGDFVLIGFDLKKSIPIMTLAYNDRQGVTRDFNLNLLHRINKELGGSFDLDKFEFYSTYDVFTGAMESYLVSLEKQSVHIEAVGQSFDFEPYEPIHTEYSYKYLESDIESLAQETGYRTVAKYYDPRHWFVDAVWQVVKNKPEPPVRISV